MSVPEGGQTYLFGTFALDTREGQLLRHGRALTLTPKAFALLVALVENAGHCLSKEQLLRRVWPDAVVAENNLAQNISQLRKVLQPDGEGDSCCIETVPRRGYRFRAQVQRQAGAPLSAAAAAAAPSAEFPPELLRVPATKYAQSGDLNIAYQTLGHGPLDLVFVMGWVSHLEYFWREPRFARFLRRLASFSRLILFDKRGTGLSDRVPVDELPTLEQRMDDLRAVLAAVGSERAALCGVSEGEPMSALFAATYPAQTLALVMIGTYAKRIRDADYPWAPTAAERELFFEHLREHWGGPVGIEERAPSAAADPQFREWWAEYLRMGASPGAALALTKMNAEIDVRQVLPTVRVPTLVLHRVGDRCLKVEEGRYVAAAIPGARYVELPGDDHLPFIGDQDAIVDEMEEFLTGVRHRHEPERVLTTLLFLTVVDSAAQAARLGATRWQSLLASWRAELRKEIEWFRGAEVDMTGEHALATFDGPARGIRAASAVCVHAARLGIEARAGLHTGECDRLANGRLGGLAVALGQAVCDRAAPGEVLATATVRDLVAGSGIGWRERGRLSHPSARGEWRLFGVERGTVS
jgi:DNA-binding winged helix-turn-helix (wHTH) protein/pimeloyl-ACP methyl ester carboxylesterase/class 3 adenylate cyclase